MANAAEKFRKKMSESYFDHFVKINNSRRNGSRQIGSRQNGSRQNGKKKKWEQTDKSSGLIWILTV